MKTIANVVEIPLAQIVPGDNDRTVFDPQALQDLADNIKADGLMQPITVRPLWSDVGALFGNPDPSNVTYQIVAGERRFRAVSLLGWPAISAIVRELNDEQADALMLAENVHRADLNPMDEARAYHKRMDKHGWSIAQIADKASVSVKRASARLKLLDLVPEAQKLITDRQMGVQFGEVMSPLDNNRQRIALRYVAQTERPLLREFKAIVGGLLEEQAQESLFDADLFIVQALHDHNTERDAHNHRRFPTNDDLPLMHKVGTIGLSLEAYIAQLLQSDDLSHREAAAVVGTVYQGMLRAGMCFPPRPERKSPLDSVTISW